MEHRFTFINVPVLLFLPEQPSVAYSTLWNTGLHKAAQYALVSTLLAVGTGPGQYPQRLSEALGLQE
jgi:hypothetical protein